MKTMSNHWTLSSSDHTDLYLSTHTGTATWKEGNLEVTLMNSSNEGGFGLFA